MNSIVCPLKSSVSATILALGMLAVQPAFATDDTWVGNTSINWATAANWNPAAVPVAGDDLLFGLAGTAGANLTNDIAAGTFFTGITFNSGASAFTFFGNSIGITSGMTNSSGVTQTISNNIVLGGNATVDTEAGGTTILASLISGNFGLTNNGAGTLILATNTTFGANGSTFTGGVTVNAGTLQISQPPQGGKTCLGSGPLTVNAGAMVTDNADGYGYGSGSVPTIYVNGGAINSYKGTYPNICFVNGGTIKVFGAFGTLNGNGSACGITNLPSGATAIMGADPSAAAGTWNNTKPLTLSVAQGTVTGGPYPGVDMLFSATLRHSGLVFKTGNGTLEMSGANSGVTGFTISNGTVVISGSLPSSCMVTNAGGALCGSNSISGSVTDVSSAAQINQETNYLITGAAGTLTIGGNLDMSAGGDCSLDLVTSAASGNDSIAVGGALVLGSGTVFHLKALGGSANLAAADYVLIQGSSPPSGSVNPAPAWDGTVPANAGGYSVQISGNNVILRPNYVPLVTSAAAAPSPATNGENVLLTVVVTNGTPLYNVTVNASAIGASSSVALALQGSGVTPGVGYVYTNTVAVATTNAGNYLLPINVTDSASYTVSNNVPLTVAVYLTWNGDAGGNSKWDTAGELEWRNGLVYGQEDTVRFDDTATGLNATNVNLEAALSPAGVVVSNTAGTPTGIYTFNDGTGAGGGSIIGSGGVIKQGSGELLMAEGSDGFSNGIVVGGGTLIYSNSTGTVAISGGLTVTNNSSVLLDQIGAISGNMTIGAGSSVQAGANDTFGSLPSGSITMDGTLAINRTDDLSVSNVISGAATGSLIKTNADTITLFSANSFAGNITVYGGTLSNNVTGASDGGTGGFGASTNAGRVITVYTNATLTDGKNNWFGGKTANDASFPALIINGGTVFSPRYTGLGNVTLENGASLTANHGTNGTDGSKYGGYYDYQFRGTVTVTGSTPITITNGDNWGDHLSTNTVFDVPVTGGSGPDLTVACPLINQSGDYGSAPGGFTKTGLGTMLFSSAVPLFSTNEYSGNTVISQGTLALGGNTTITNSRNIIVAGGATLDVSGLAGFALGASQTLSNSTSTAVLNGNVNASTGGISLTYASGTPSLTAQNGALTLAAATGFTVDNTGSALAAGGYKVISAGTGGSVAGTAPASVAVIGGGLAADTEATLSISNSELYLNVITVPVAYITSVNVSGTSLSISATNGLPGGTWTLLQSTNIALPLAQWQTNRTGTFGGSGDLSTNIVNTATNTQEFYILKQ